MIIWFFEQVDRGKNEETRNMKYPIYLNNTMHTICYFSFTPAHICEKRAFNSVRFLFSMRTRFFFAYDVFFFQ